MPHHSHLCCETKNRYFWLKLADYSTWQVVFVTGQSVLFCGLDQRALLVDLAIEYPNLRWDGPIEHERN